VSERGWLGERGVRVGGSQRVAGTWPPAAPGIRWFSARATVVGRADLTELDAAETARAAEFAFPADRHLYQVAHVMLRRVLAGKLGAEPGELRFGREPCPLCGRAAGRPVLAAGGPCFSLAHSGDAIVIAVADHPVGVDVERRTPRCLCPVTGAMPAADARAVAALAEPARHEAILRWWVRAEAVLKCTGAGIAHGTGGTALPRQGAPGVTDLAAPTGYLAAFAAHG
jgi:4'-phosphopantetheinyl transferase